MLLTAVKIKFTPTVTGYHRVNQESANKGKKRGRNNNKKKGGWEGKTGTRCAYGMQPEKSGKK